MFSSLMFGDGSDGDLTVLNGQSVVLPDGRPWFFDNLTIDDGGELFVLADIASSIATIQPKYTALIRVANTLTINGTLNARGLAGDNAAGAVGAQSGQDRAGLGFQATFGTGGGFDFGGEGGDGGGADIGNSGRGGSGSNNFAPGSGYMGGQCGGDGGNGGDSAPGVGDGGEGGWVPPPLTFCEATGEFYPAGRLLIEGYSFSSAASYLANVIGGGGAGGGGGGGGGGTPANSGAGGAGGDPGGSIYIFARNIIIGATGIIAASGGNGGNGSNASVGPNGGGGAGGGGGGGLVYLMHRSLVNNGSIDVAGGSAGNPGTGAGTGEAGANGLDGTPGVVKLLNVITGAIA